METKEINQKEVMLSALLDGELSPSEAASLEAELKENAELNETYEKMQSIHSAFSEMKKERTEVPDFDLFWSDLSSRCVRATNEKNTDFTEIRELLISRTKTTWFERLFSVLVPSIAGVAAALITVLLFMPGKTVKKSEKTMESKKAPMVIPADAKTVNNTTNKNNNLKTVHLTPDPILETIIESTDSCIIESMQSAEDIITAVFKVEDKDGSMITVIWLPVDENSEDTI